VYVAFWTLFAVAPEALVHTYLISVAIMACAPLQRMYTDLLSIAVTTNASPLVMDTNGTSHTVDAGVFVPIVLTDPGTLALNTVPPPPTVFTNGTSCAFDTGVFMPIVLAIIIRRAVLAVRFSLTMWTFQGNVYFFDDWATVTATHFPPVVIAKCLWSAYSAILFCLTMKTFRSYSLPFKDWTSDYIKCVSCSDVFLLFTAIIVCR